jgi:hypothetical protein
VKSRESATVSAAEQADADVEVVEEPGGDGGVAAVVAAAADEKHVRAGGGEFADATGYRVAARLHQLFPRNAQRGGVLVHHRHPSGGNHGRRFARRADNSTPIGATAFGTFDSPR